MPDEDTKVAVYIQDKVLQRHQNSRGTVAEYDEGEELRQKTLAAKLQNVLLYNTII